MQSGMVEPVYDDEKSKVTFVPNPNDPPDGYDVFVGEDHFYIQSRILSDLAHPSRSTENVMGSLENACGPGRVKYVLQQNKLTPEELHIALLKVRNLELEAEVRTVRKHGNSLF